MEITSYRVTPDQLDRALQTIISRGESVGSWVCVYRMGVAGIESSTCTGRVRVEIVDEPPSPQET